MPKLKEVTDEEIAALVDRMQGLSGEAHELTRRLHTNLRSPVASGVQSASSALSASRAFGDLAHALLVRASLAEQERDIREMVKKRMNAEASAQ